MLCSLVWVVKRVIEDFESKDTAQGQRAANIMPLSYPLHNPLSLGDRLACHLMLASLQNHKGSPEGLERQ